MRYWKESEEYFSVWTDFTGGKTGEQERLSALNCFASKPGRVYIIKSKDHWGL